MKRLSISPLAILTFLGCSEAPSAREDDRPDASQETTPDASMGDAASSETAYRDAVLAASWRELPNAPKISGKQDDLYFLSPNYGFSVNGEGRIFRTEDGGDSWKVLLEKPGTYFRSIVMIDEGYGFAGNIGPGVFPGVTDALPLYETKDRGETWTAVERLNGAAPAGICNMHKLDADHVYAVGRVGGPSFFLASNDAGATWTSTDLSSALDMLIDVRMTSPRDGLLVGRKDDACTVLRTSDAGANWTPVFTSAVAGTLCWKMSFPSDDVGYVSIQGGKTPTSPRRETAARPGRRSRSAARHSAGSARASSPRTSAGWRATRAP